MNVFQILITDDPVNQSDLSPVIAAMQSVVDCFPNTNHQLLQRPELASLCNILI